LSKQEKSSRIFWIAEGGAFLAVAFCFLPYLSGLWIAWQTAEYSHGILIPLLALLIGWHRLTEKKPALSPSWVGLPLILTGFAFLGISQLSAFEPPAHYGFVICLAGLILSFFGWKTLKTLAPSLIYLFFAIPLPRLIEVVLTDKMQLISTTIGVVILQTFGISVFQEGNIIDLGTVKLQVVEACSGLRYLYPLLSFGFIVSFLFDGPFWKRAVIFLSTVPLTLGMNALRIALVGILVNRWGSGMAEGFMHYFEGWSIFALCVAVLLMETWLLSKIGKNKDHLRFDYISLPTGSLFAESCRLKSSGISALVLCVLLAGLLTFANLNRREEIVPPHMPFALFPLTLGQWHGRQESLDPTIRETLRATDYWNADYRYGEVGTPINLFIAWYASQRVGVAAHSPANCIPGSGWQVVQRRITPITLDTMTLSITRMIISKDTTSLLVYYWFDQRGRIMNEQYGAKWYLLVDSITKNRTDGAIIRLVTPLVENEDERAGDARLLDFMRVLFPTTQSYIPR